MSLRFKRHYKLFVLLALLSAVLVLGLGDQSIVAHSVQAEEQLAEQALSYVSSVAVLGDTVVHNVEILISDATLSE